MNLYRSRGLSLFLLVVPFSFVLPAAASDLTTAWRAASSHDATYAAADAALRAAQEKIPQGDALLAPRVDLQVNANEGWQSYDSGKSSVKAGSRTQGQQVGTTFSLSKPVYDVASSVARDRLRKEAAQAQVQFAGARQDLMLRVSRAYFDVLLARENLRLAQAQKEAIQQQLGLATQAYQLGMTSVTDADDAQARFDNTAATESAAQIDLENKSDAFRTLTGLESAGISDVPSSVVDALPTGAQMDALVLQAGDANTNVLLQKLGVDIAHRAIDGYRLSATPVLSAVANLGHQFEAGSISASGGRDLTRHASVGLVLTIPLADGGERRSLMRQALALEDQQVSLLEAARREAQRLARAYAADLRGGAQRIASLRRARISAENSVKSNQTGREVGVRTTIDVLNAEQGYYQTLFNLSAARYEQLFNQLQLLAVAGALNEASLAEVNAALIH